MSEQVISAQDLRENLREHRKFYLFEGWLLIAIGVLAAVLPMVTAVAINVIVAISLLFAGVARLLTWRRKRLDSIWRVLGGLLFVLGGILMLVYPMQGVAAFVLVLGAVLLLEGLLGVSAAFSMSDRLFSGWLMVSGLVSALLGVLVLTFFPEAGVFYLAIVVGLSFALTGGSLLLLVRESGQTDAGDARP